MEDLRGGSTTSQLRHDIDTGLTGDKVAETDPAAAPLGTDDEAAGRPPSPAAVRLARAQENVAGKPGVVRTPESGASGPAPVIWFWVAVAVFAVVILGAFALVD